jgi:hypothetical protein
MSKEIMIKSDFTMQLEEFDKIQDTCRKLMSTKHYANLGESGIHAIMARAKALGIHPFEALNGSFYVVQGRVGMSTEMMAALVRQRGHSIQKDSKSHAESIILHGKRADNGDTWTCSFSKDDAIAAGLWNGPTWKKYPTIMLYNRCMSMLFRQLFPDLSLGAGYVEDELHEIKKTGDYAKSLPEAEYHIEQPLQIEEKPKEEKKRVLIDEEQIKCLEIFIDGDEEYRKSIFARLSPFGVNTLSDIPKNTYDKVLADAKANFERREEERIMKQQAVDE